MPDCLAYQSALNITQQGAKILFDWLDISSLIDGDSLSPSLDLNIQAAVAEAQKQLNWSQQLNNLQLVWKNTNSVFNGAEERTYYWQPKSIEDYQPRISYPQNKKPTVENNQKFKEQISQEIKQLKLRSEDWQNLSFLTILLEKYGSFLGVGTENIALIDLVMATSALAIVLIEQATALNLIAGKLFGIKPFITSIGSKGELQFIRARSFYLELVKQEIVQQLLTAFNLPHSNLIDSGSDIFYILAPATKQNQDKIIQVRQHLNQYLLSQFQGQIFLGLESQECAIKNINSNQFAECWLSLHHKLVVNREQKFSEGELVNQLLKPQIAYEPCALCHRDDTDTLQPLSQHGQKNILVCSTCDHLFKLGNKLDRVKGIVRSTRKSIPKTIEKVSCLTTNYHLFSNYSDIDFKSCLANDTVLLLNDWQLNHYRQMPVIPFRWGIYGEKEQLVEKTDLMPTQPISTKANQVPKVAYLTLRIDNWRQIIFNQLKEQVNLARLLSLSHQIDYFMKIYLASLAKNRDRNLAHSSQLIKLSNHNSYDHISFIYADCEDMLIAGNLNEVIEFCFDIYQCFRAYTAYNQDLTISAGINFNNANFSVYQAVKDSQIATTIAQQNGGDSLSLFGEVFRWDEWLGQLDFLKMNTEIQEYLKPENKPEITGILPFVKAINQQIDRKSCRYFSSNLLATAQLQEQQLQKAKNKANSDHQAIRYFLNLPKIAYTLSQLPINIRDHPDFAPIRTSLKNPWNARYFRAIATLLKLVNPS